MTFEFFNTSRLAFGSKLTSVFKQLNNNMNYAITNLNNVLSDLEYFQQYVDKNYRVPVPTREGMAVRTNELFAVIDELAHIKEIQYEDNLLTIELTFFNSTTHRITNAVGSTDLTEGYAFVVPSPSSSRLTRTIRFSENEATQGSEILLFSFRVNEDGNIFLGGNLTNPLRLFPQDATQYTSLTQGDSITFPYTATDYECICAVGYQNNIDVQVNSESIIKGTGGAGYVNRNHAIVYLKPGDVVDGTIDYGFKIDYNY